MIPERDRIKTVMTPAEIAEAINSGDYSAEMLMQHLIRHHNRLERELAESAQSLDFQTQLNREVIELEKKTLGERNDARAMVDSLRSLVTTDHESKESFIYRVAVTLNMPTAAEIDAHLDECVAMSERDWKPLPGDPDVFYPRQ